MNVKDRVEEALSEEIDELIPRIDESQDVEYEYCVVDDVFVSTHFHIQDKYDIDKRVVVRIVYPDGESDMKYYDEFEELTSDEPYECPHCDSDRVRADESGEGWVSCRNPNCDWKNHDHSTMV